MEPVDVTLPVFQASSLSELCRFTGFTSGNGPEIAKHYDEQGAYKPFEEPYRIVIGIFEKKFDCIHSQYAAIMHEGAAGLTDLLDISGLFRLAMYLKHVPLPALKDFEGTVSAFGSMRPLKRTVINNEHHTAKPLLDFATPALYILNGTPMSIYYLWHGESTSNKPGSQNFFAIQSPEWAWEPVKNI
jgi:hypothetical protein